MNERPVSPEEMAARMSGRDDVAAYDREWDAIQKDLTRSGVALNDYHRTRVITRMLGEWDWIRLVDNETTECVFCDHTILSDVTTHKTTCPYRLAREWCDDHAGE